MIPGINHGSRNALFWFLKPASGTLDSVSVSLSDQYEMYGDALRHWFAPNKIPFGYTSHSAYLKYIMVPHTIRPLADNRFLVGHQGVNPHILDIGLKTYVHLGALTDIPSFFYASTPCVSTDGEACFTARWPIKDTARFDNSDSFSELIRLDIDGGEEVLGIIPFNDIHQVAVSPDGRCLTATEFGLNMNGPTPPIASGNRKERWDQLSEIGLRPSRVAVIDLEKGSTIIWESPWPSSAHMVFDPDEPGVFFLSCHNLGISDGVLAYFGPGRLLRIRIREDNLEVESVYSHPNFYRITTHDIIRFRGKKALAVTNYPNKCEIIDAEDLSLIQSIDLFPLAASKNDGKIGFPNLARQAPFSVQGMGGDGTVFLNSSENVHFLWHDGEKECLESMVFNDDPGTMVLGHTTSFDDELMRVMQ